MADDEQRGRVFSLTAFLKERPGVGLFVGFTLVLLGLANISGFVTSEVSFARQLVTLGFFLFGGFALWTAWSARTPG
jgi:hypothetical protein